MQQPTFKHLLEWALAAQAKREDSWNHITKQYSLSLAEATQATTPPTKSHQVAIYQEIVTTLNHALWNEVQEWNRALL